MGPICLAPHTAAPRHIRSPVTPPLHCNAPVGTPLVGAPKPLRTATLLQSESPTRTSRLIPQFLGPSPCRPPLKSRSRQQPIPLISQIPPNPRSDNLPLPLPEPAKNLTPLLVYTLRNRNHRAFEKILRYDGAAEPASRFQPTDSQRPAAPWIRSFDVPVPHTSDLAHERLGANQRRLARFQAASPSAAQREIPTISNDSAHSER